MNRRGFFGAIAAALGCARAPGMAQELQDIRRMGEHAFRPTHLMVPKPDHVAVYDFAIGNDLPTVMYDFAIRGGPRRIYTEAQFRAALANHGFVVDAVWAECSRYPVGWADIEEDARRREILEGILRQREEEGAGEGTVGPVSPPSG